MNRYGLALLLAALAAPIGCTVEAPVREVHYTEPAREVYYYEPATEVYYYEPAPGIEFDDGKWEYDDGEWEYDD